VWSDGARQAVNGRSAEICLARGSLPLCLDALTAPLGIVWVQGDGEVRLSASDETDAETIAAGRRRAARHALEYAVQQHPDFVLGPHALVALGNMAQQDGRIDEAERLYTEMLEKFPRSPVRSDAWFNLAKLELKRDHTDAALNAFWYVIDSGGAPATASVAYLYIGRLLLDAEQPRRAITPLIRATQWTTDPAVRTKSVLCLASAYLLYGNPEAANEVLMDFRSDVESQSLQAAFLSALARYRAAENPTRRLYEGQALLTAVDPVKPVDFFGRYGWYLCGRTYEELLLPEIAVGVYREALEVDERPPYHDAIAYGLGTCLADIGEHDAAQSRLIELTQHAAPEWQRQAAFRLCRLQLDSDQALEASQTARTLVDQCTAQGDKARALQLLGAAYQQLGDHAAAALCFAGTAPGASPSAETEEH
jgi:tetratricopeptide (TPR) repeat protein